MTPIDRFFSEVPNLPSMPRIVQQLIASLGRDDIDIGSLVAQLKQDQSLSARVLRLANSSHYGASHKIGAIDDAVTLIGLDAVRTLVIASGITNAFTTVPGIDLKRFWKHSMLSAQIARSLGRSVGVNAEFAYTAALMHRIGQLLVNIAFPGIAKRIAEENHDSSVTELAAVESELLGLDHCRIGAELARLWHFPAAIQNALRWYAHPLAKEACPYAGIVYLAADIAFGAESHRDPAGIIDALDSTLVQRLVLDDHDWESEVEAALDGEVATENVL